MKKVLLVNGSPHKNGNTATILDFMEKVFHEKGITTDRFELGSKPVRGCISCRRCETVHRCAFHDDPCNELIEKILDADGVILGSPVYFAGPNGALCAILDRAFFAASNYGGLFAGKAGAAVVSVWREGGSAAIDRLNKYFTFAEMPVISSNYWSVVLNSGSDEYGNAVVTKLAENMSRFLLEEPVR